MQLVSHRETFVLEATIAEWMEVRRLAPTLQREIDKRLGPLPLDMHPTCKMKMSFTAPIGSAERQIRYLTELAKPAPSLAVSGSAR